MDIINFEEIAEYQTPFWKQKMEEYGNVMGNNMCAFGDKTMKSIKSILFLFVSIFLTTNANAEPPNRVAIFVDGYTDCCVSSMSDVKDALNSLGIYFFDTPWNSLSEISGATSESEAGEITAGATKNFVGQMNTYFSNLPEGTEVYLIGHSFGGDSILQFLDQYRRTKVKIRLVALLDPIKFGGLRPSGHTIPDNVDYFFNRWQTNKPWPIDIEKPGNIQCNAKNCNDQKEQSRAREVNGDTIYLPCRWDEVTCPGFVLPIPGVRKGSRGQKQKRLHHSAVPYDNYIEKTLVDIITMLSPRFSQSPTPPPPLPPTVKLCNKSSEDLMYATKKYIGDPKKEDFGKWVVDGWTVLKLPSVRPRVSTTMEMLPFTSLIVTDLSGRLSDPQMMCFFVLVNVIFTS